MAIYIPSKKLKVFGLSLFVVCLLTFTALLIIYNKSGEVIATAQLSEPINKESLIAQKVNAEIQVLSDNAMKKIGIASMPYDYVEWMKLRFEPIKLTPEMGEVALILRIKATGFVVDNLPGANLRFGDEKIELINTNTGKIDHIKNYNSHEYDDADADGKYFIISHGDKKTNSSFRLSGTEHILSRLSVSEAGNYTLNAEIQKLKFRHPITEVELIVKKGMMVEPNATIIGLLLLGIILGLALHIITTPPEMRKKSK